MAALLLPSLSHLPSSSHSVSLSPYQYPPAAPPPSYISRDCGTSLLPPGNPSPLGTDNHAFCFSILPLPAWRGITAARDDDDDMAFQAAWHHL